MVATTMLCRTAADVNGHGHGMVARWILDLAASSCASARAFALIGEQFHNYWESRRSNPRFGGKLLKS